MTFADRRDAGRRLAERLAQRPPPDATVLAIPRGGVIVGYEIARALAAPLDVALSRKIGAPTNPELAIGAVAEDGPPLFDDDLVERLGVPRHYLDDAVADARAEILRRARLYREGRPPAAVAGRSVILVDDGVATGSTVRALLLALRAQQPAGLLLAVPVAPRQVWPRLADLADEAVCLHAPPDFYAVGQFYVDFDQTTDGEVVARLRAAGGPAAPPAPAE